MLGHVMSCCLGRLISFFEDKRKFLKHFLVKTPSFGTESSLYTIHITSIYIYLVGGFKHFLFSIFYMACHPSH